MKPAPPVMQARLIACTAARAGRGSIRERWHRSSLEREARGERVAVEHPDRLQRELLEVLAEAVELLQQVVGDGDDVTADLVGLHEVEDLARRGPDQLRARGLQP